MENTHDLIIRYFESKKIVFSTSEQVSCSYHAPFSSEALLQDCRVDLTPLGDLLKITVTLPVRVKRTEADEVYRELALINEFMPEYAGYILDPLDGAIRMVIHADAPTDMEQVEAKLNTAVKAVEEDIEAFMNAISVAREKSKKKAKEPEGSEGRPTGLADRFLSFIGFVNDGDTDEDDFDI